MALAEAFQHRFLWVLLDDNGVPCFEKQHHASGHASGEDITRAIEQVDPDYIVPIHTEARDWFARSFENVILVEEGETYRFNVAENRNEE